MANSLNEHLSAARIVMSNPPDEAGRMNDRRLNALTLLLNPQLTTPEHVALLQEQAPDVIPILQRMDIRFAVSKTLSE